MFEENEPGGMRALYTCGMHPQVVQDHPGNCPICGMKPRAVAQTTIADTIRGVREARG